MKILFSILISVSLYSAAATKDGIAKDHWKIKLDSLLNQDPDYIYNDNKLEVVAQQTQQAKMYLIPRLELFHRTSATRANSIMNSHQYGLSAQMNLFHFGKSYYGYQGQNSLYESEKIEHKQKKIEIENKFLLTLFKNTLLLKRLALYKQIEALKRKSLRVAQQRYDRGNLPRQQVDKVEIDLTNLFSQRMTIERELAESELDVLKYQLGDFKREWPFSETIAQVRKTKKTEEFADIKVLDFKTNAYENQLQSSRLNYLPRVDLSGSTYEWKQEGTRSQEWDVSLTVSWPLWDNYSRKLENLTAYRDFQYWQIEKSRMRQDWERRVSTKEDQLNKLSTQLKQSADNLKKLNALYNDTEALFSQGRITVNELFQDQQLLLETQINYENELYAFHQFILDYCLFYSERVWECI